jgi:hypothetical protein
MLTYAISRVGQEVSAVTSTTVLVSIRQHTSAYVSIRQHTSAYVSIRQHTPAYVSIRTEESAMASTNVLNCPHTSVDMCAGILLDFHREREDRFYIHICILGGAEAAGHMRRHPTRFTYAGPFIYI